MTGLKPLKVYHIYQRNVERLCKYLGLDKTLIFDNNPYKFSVPTVDKLARLLRVNAYDLLTFPHCRTDLSKNFYKHCSQMDMDQLDAFYKVVDNYIQMQKINDKETNTTE